MASNATYRIDANQDAPPESMEAQLARSAREDEMVDEGLADIEAGRLVSHESVRAWVNSWGTPNELPAPRPGE